MSNKILLIDGMALLFRHFYATSIHKQFMRDSKGIPTNAIQGFIRHSYTVINDIKPTHVAVCWDMGSKTFRNDMFEAYKSNRVAPPEEMIPQFDRAKEIAEKTEQTNSDAKKKADEQAEKDRAKKEDEDKAKESNEDSDKNSDSSDSNNASENSSDESNSDSDANANSTEDSQSNQDQNSDDSVNQYSDSASNEDVQNAADDAANNQTNQNTQSNQNQNQSQESHTVTGKENLYRIAIQYYGSGSPENVEKIRQANGISGNEISQGQNLVIP